MKDGMRADERSTCIIWTKYEYIDYSMLRSIVVCSICQRKWFLQECKFNATS